MRANDESATTQRLVVRKKPKTDELEDWGEVARRFLENDPVAVAKVIKLIIGHLVRLGAYGMGTAAHADLVQEVLKALVLALRNRSLRETCAFVSYVGVITRNKFTDTLRRDPVAPMPEGPEVADPATPHSDAAPEHIDLRHALDELPEEERRAIELAYFRDLSFDDIARELRVPRGSVGRILDRARELIRKRISK